MHVMAAGMHDPDLFIEVGRLHLGFESKVRILGDRKSIHIGTHGNHRAGPPSFEQSHHTGMGDTGLDLQSEASQVLGDKRCRLELSIAELGILVDPMTKLEDVSGVTID